MGRIDAIIPDDLEKKLRMKAVDKYGGKKGSLTAALQPAIKEWVDDEDEKSDIKKGSKR